MGCGGGHQVSTSRRCSIRSQGKQGRSEKEVLAPGIRDQESQAVDVHEIKAKPELAAQEIKLDYKTAARDAKKRVEPEMAKKEIEQKVKLEKDFEREQDLLNAFESASKIETKTPSSLSMKLNAISGQTLGMVTQGTKVQ